MPHALGIHEYVAVGIMSHLGLCRLRDHVAFGIMSHLGLCCIRDYAAFGIMSHLGLCRIRDHVIRDTAESCRCTVRNCSYWV